MAKNKPRRTDAQVKSDLKILKKAGLYSGDLRKAPTRYGRGQAKKYADVIGGGAKVISVPVEKQSHKNKGVKAAKAEARAVAADFPKTVRAKGNKLIVRVSRPSEVPTYSKKMKTLVIRHTNTAGQKLTYEYVRNLKVKELDQYGLPYLNKNETFALPLSRGREGIEYSYRASAQEIMEVINSYETKKNPYRGAGDNIMIVYPGTSRKAPSKRQIKNIKAENVVPFPSRVDEDEEDQEE